MEKIVSLCKRRGFIFPGSEIYGGLANSWDYGPLGVLLKNNISIKSKEVVIVDDIISTAHTMIEAVKHVKKYKPISITCIGVHGLFVENAYKKLKKAGADSIITTNSIPHITNKIDLAGLISKEI